MIITRVLNDERATRVSDASRHEMNEMSSKVLESKYDTKGLVFAVGRGETDTKKTYIELKNTNGTSCFLYPNDAGDGVVVSTVKP